MDLLCVSNGHGEDGIAVRVLQELRRLPGAPKVAALPIVGEGRTFQKVGIPIVGPTQAMPSGGFIYMDRRQMMRDIQGGLVALTLAQIKAMRQWAKAGGVILAVGDIVPLALAWGSGANYAFIGTAKSEYFLRDELGRLASRPRLEGWAGSVYLPWERWLMGHRRCQAVFVRDQLTADTLQRWQVPAVYAGNPMMDGLTPTADRLPLLTEAVPPGTEPLTLALLPGSRAPEAFENWQLILEAVESILAVFSDRPLCLLAAIAPALNLSAFKDELLAANWVSQAGHYPTFSRHQGVLVLTQNAFAECLHLADAAIALAGTATEQAVGLGKPVVTFGGPGPQFTPVFAEAQSRLLGSSIILVAQPAAVGMALKDCLQDQPRLQQIAANGHHRMGSPGSARQIATVLHKFYSEPG